jgi:UbiD family decarboxylase
MIYKDIRQYLNKLDELGLLIHVTRPTNKDTEIGPLVRWQFQGLDPDQRKGWLFENVTDSRGRNFDAKVAVAVVGASPRLYALSLGVESEAEIEKKWEHAITHPVEPTVVEKKDAPVKELVFKGEDIIRSGGVDKLPIPVVNPGTDPAAYFSAPIWITKDPETGVYNAGTYRSQVKAIDRLGIHISSGHDGRTHWFKARARGEPLEAILILSPDPTVSLCSVSKLDQSEYVIAGALNEGPLQLVRAETVDMLIPATAEVAIEGIIRTDVLEMEGPFGEFSGYTGPADYKFVFDVTAITHRRTPIVQVFISEMPPSESTVIRKFGRESPLRHELASKVPSFKDVNIMEEGGCEEIVVISLHNPAPGEASQALRTAVAFNRKCFKWLIAVNDDINIHDLFSIMWAISFRVQPHRDVEIQRGKNCGLDPSSAPSTAPYKERDYPDGLGGSRILIDATLKWKYPPVSLPSKELMEHARKIWEELGLPKLTPRFPWHGYELGYWPKEWAEAAKLAIQGRYLETGEKYKYQRTLSSYIETGEVIPPEEGQRSEMPEIVAPFAPITLGRENGKPKAPEEKYEELSMAD